MSTLHNSAYQPPFPALSVTLRGGAEQIAPLRALIDTGADITFVPFRLLEQAKSNEGGLAKIRSHFWEAHLAQLYVIEFQIGALNFPGIYVIADRSGDEIILGRNVLNKLALFLDGPTQQTDLLDDGTVQRLRARRE
jgi:predicted aspartyl protease